MTDRPIINLADVPLREVAHGERFRARVGRIGPLVGARQLGCQLHVVPAGRTAYPRHAHHVNEEMFIVLDGTGTYRAGDAEWEIHAGDVIAAPAGSAETAHQIVNSGSEEMRYLAVSTRVAFDVVEYPDSNKFMVASMVPDGAGMRDAALHFVGRKETSLDYWDGE